MGRAFGNPVLVQSIKQAAGLMAMAVKYHDRLPDKDTGASQGLYALPFSGAWTVFNGGVDKETSHSWNVCAQRYAYDFVILDDEGRSCPPDADAADRVARGQVVGLCGSSGISTGPHLHYHVQLGASFYTAPGVPIRFEGAQAHPAPGYAAADPRPVLAGAHDLFPPFLTRGLRVEAAGTSPCRR